MVNLIQLLQVSYDHLIPVHNLPFSFTSITFLQVSRLVSHKCTQSGPIFVIGAALWAEKLWRCHENWGVENVPLENLWLRSTERPFDSSFEWIERSVNDREDFCLLWLVILKSGVENANAHMVVCGLSLHQGSTESRKTLDQKFIFQIGTLNPHGIRQWALFIQLIYSVVFHVTRHQPKA